MPVPIRCFTCGRVLGNKWERYFALLHDGMAERDAMTAVGIPAKMYCCRALMLTTVDDSEKYLTAPPAGPNPAAFTFVSDNLQEKSTRIYNSS